MAIVMKTDKGRSNEQEDPLRGSYRQPEMLQPSSPGVISGSYQGRQEGQDQRRRRGDRRGWSDGREGSQVGGSGS